MSELRMRTVCADPGFFGQVFHAHKTVLHAVFAESSMSAPAAAETPGTGWETFSAAPTGLDASPAAATGRLRPPVAVASPAAAAFTAAPPEPTDSFMPAGAASSTDSVLVTQPHVCAPNRGTTAAECSSSVSAAHAAAHHQLLLFSSARGSFSDVVIDGAL